MTDATGPMFVTAEERMMVEHHRRYGRYAGQPKAVDMVNHPPHMTDAELQEALSKVPRSVAVGKDTVDMVNSPPHYKANKSGVECIDVVEHMSFCLGNAVKYIWRADLKGNKIEDLKKARWYLDREIQRLEKQGG